MLLERLFMLVVIGIVIVLATVVVLAELGLLKLFNINVNINVVDTYIDIELDIDRPTGSVEYPNITVLVLDSDASIIFKLISTEISGNFRIALSSEAKLVADDGKVYRVSMPCLFTVNTTCARVLMLIPGYDTPLHLPRGRYTVSLNISWFNAEGSGRALIRLGILKE